MSETVWSQSMRIVDGHSSSSSAVPSSSTLTPVDLNNAHADLDEGGGGGGCGRGRKLMHNASSKVAVVVEKMLLPLLQTPLRSHVVFDAVSDQAELDLMEEVDKQHPDIMGDSATFTAHLASLFDRYQAYARGYSAVSVVASSASSSSTSPRSASSSLSRCGMGLRTPCSGV